MKLQLFNPPVSHYLGGRYRINPPLGLPIIAALFNATNKHRAEVVDLEALGISPQALGELFRRQVERWPDVVGFTSLFSSARGVRESIRALRGAAYRGRIAVGGPYATLRPEEVRSWGADLVVTGECEGNIVELLEGGATGIQQGKAAKMEDIPIPDWKHHSPSPQLYEGNAPHLGRPEGLVLLARGCPYQCVFCGNPVFGHQKIRYRPPENIEAELIALKSQGFRALFVYDDELLGVPYRNNWLQETMSRIAPLEFVWKCQGRCSKKHITKEILETAYKGGCRAVMWGVESFSQRVLDANKKGTTLEDIWHTLRVAKEVGIKNWVFSMVGMYEETDDDAALTAKGLEEAYREGLIDYRQTTVTTVLPGTPLESLAKEQGWYSPPPESGPQMHQAYQSTPWMSAERIAYWFKKYAEVCPVDHLGKVS